MAVYPLNATSIFTTASFTSMADRQPDTGYTSDRVYNSIIFESEAGYEKRRLKSRRAKRNYSLTYSKVTGLEKIAIESFYNARSGEFESFTFDLAHVNESGTMIARFSGPLSVTHVLSAGSNVLQNFYTVSFKLQETFD